jgi:ribosomal subunit interface protein
MNIEITADNIELAPENREYIQAELTKSLKRLLQNFDPDLLKPTVKVKQPNAYEVKINFDLWLPGKKHIYSDESGENIHAAIKRLIPELRKQIRRHMSELKS